MKKKLVVFIGILLMCSTLFIGCSKSKGPAQSTSGKTTISFFHQWAEESRLPYWKDLVDRYNSTNTKNVEVIMEAVSNEPYKDKLRVILGSRDVPDIFFTWDGDYVARFADNDVILNLDSYLNADPTFRDSFNRGVFTTGSHKGSQYGLPIRTCVNFFLYNKAIFAKHNIVPPNTWDEFMRICTTLKSNGITPLALGNLEAWPLLHYISIFNLRLVPPKIFNDDYYLVTGKFDDPSYIRSLEIPLEMFNRGYFMDGVASTSQAVAREVFNVGRSAMIHDQCGSFKTYYYDKMEHDSWDIFPMPKFTGAQGDSDMLVAWIDQFVISKKCANPDAALDFLNFFYQPENQRKMTQTLGFVSTITAVATDNNISFPQLSKAMEIIDKCTGFTSVIDLEMNASVAGVYQASSQELFTGRKPADIMKSVQTEAKRVMDEMKK